MDQPVNAVIQRNAELSPVFSADVLKTWVYDGLQNVSSGEFVCYRCAGRNGVSQTNIPSLDVKTRLQAGY
jgi:hypothetical protein